MKKSIHWFFLIVGMMIAGALALSIHVILIQTVNPQFLDISVKYGRIFGIEHPLIRFCSALAAIFIYDLSKSYWQTLSFFRRVILFALLLMGLTEQLFRSPFMNILCGAPALPEILSQIPSYVAWFTLSVCVCFFGRALNGKKIHPLLQLVFLPAIISLIVFFARQLCTPLLGPVIALFASPSIQTFLFPPYSPSLLFPIYLSFIEPTLATGILFYLIKNQLNSFSLLIKGCVVGGILILLHGGVHSIFEILFSEGNLFWRVLYHGQFLWEYLALGILITFVMENTINSDRQGIRDKKQNG